jgi:hypothetical protein
VKASIHVSISDISGPLPGTMGSFENSDILSSKKVVCTFIAHPDSDFKSQNEELAYVKITPWK